MQSKEQSYYVTVRKSYDVTYQVYADSFEEALKYWEEFGDEQDVQPNDSIVLGVMVNEES
jgi:hypothetical protein